MSRKLALLCALPLSLLMVLAFAPASASATQDPAGKPPGAGPGGAREESALSVAMEDMNDVLRGMRKNVATPEGLAAAVPEVCRLQKLMIDAKNEVPALVARMEDASARKQAEIAFRLEIQSLVRALFDLERGLLEADTAKIEAAFAELDRLKNEGHDQFRKKSKR